MSELNNRHQRLQQSVCDKFVLCGYSTASRVYHDNPALMPLKDILNDPTAMIIRTDSDTVVFNENKVLELEFKTGNKEYKIPIEALPLIRHEIMSSTFGEETLYFCETPDRNFVFSTKKLPQIYSLRIPDNKEYPCKMEMIQWAINKGIMVDTSSFDRNYGSGDPFVTIIYGGYSWLPTIDEYISQSIIEKISYNQPPE